MQHQILFRRFCILLSFLMMASNAYSQRIELPDLGGASSTIISIEQEHALGQSWLRSYRSQAGVENDYVLQEYLETLIYSMLPNAGLADNRLDILVVNSPTLNAFAVPGGIIGVHTGLLLYAPTEDALSSVLAHELAHLSQRHFARSVEEQQGKTVAVMAGILAGVILAATAGGDAGLAVISATQAANLESQLSYSRQNEQEADRIGLEILSNSGRDPDAMTQMFEEMLKTTRYVGYQAPEYLRSHPLTEKRVNDAGNRARQYQPRDYSPNPNYALMQTRVKVAGASSPQLAVRQFLAEYRSNPSIANRYGLALAYRDSLQIEEALSEAVSLYDSQPSNLLFAVLYADLLGASGDGEKAVEVLSSHLRYKPSSYALNMALAKAHIYQSNYSAAAEIYKQQTTSRPNDVLAWYEYSEALGLAGDILELHKARTQYFVLTGSYQRAIQQLQYAKRLVTDKPIDTAILDQRISEIAKLMGNSTF